MRFSAGTALARLTALAAFVAVIVIAWLFGPPEFGRASELSDVPDAIVALLARDGTVKSCANESGKNPASYAARAFTFRSIGSYGGRRMISAEARDGCLAVGQSTRVVVFESVRRGYRVVLRSMTMPGYSREDRDGTITLPNHELMQTIFESTYVWNGTAYAFSDARSHVYDVVLGIRRPSIVRVRFARGATSATLSGSAATNFGQDYVFYARAGQRIALDLEPEAEPAPFVDLFHADRLIGTLSHDRYRGILPSTGTYRLSIEGGANGDGSTLSPYELRIAINDADR